MRALPVFELSASHPYFPAGRCPDVTFEPTVATALRMRGAGFVAKAAGDRLRVFLKATAERKPLIPPIGPVVLGFHMRSRSSALPLVTEQADLDAQPAPLFGNGGRTDAAPIVLTLGTRHERATETRTVQAPAASEAFVLAGRPQEGAQIGDFTLSGGGVAGVSAYDATLRRIVVDSHAATAGSTFTVSYPVRPALPPGVLADVEIDLALSATAALPSTAFSFVVPLAVRSVHWGYYLATTLTDALNTFTITDVSPADAGPPVTFPAAGRTELTASDIAADPVAAAITRGTSGPGLRILRFVSAAPVALRQAPRRLELRLDGTTKLFDALPNPEPANSGLLSPNTQFLFAVVRHMAA